MRADPARSTIPPAGRLGRRAPGVGAVVAALGLLAGAGLPACSGPGARATVSGAAATTCTDATVIGRWPLPAAARETIAFPIEESDLSAAGAVARAGYAGLLLFGTTAPADLGAQLASLRRQVPRRAGLSVMTDEEGGGVQRMANLVGSMPWASQMGSGMSASAIRSLARTVAARMADHGVDMDLAPVLDVDGRAVEPGPADPDGYRSFSGRTAVVRTDGVAFAEGLRAGGVVPVVKHFPGLGGVSRNTDDGPATTLPWSTLQRVALPPFRAAVAAGVPAVMVSLATVPGFTEGPAALSPRMVTGELRGALHFRGLIVTDSLSAGAVTAPPSGISVPTAAVRALGAGDDLLLFGTATASVRQNLGLAAAMTSAIVGAVHSGRLQAATVVGAAARVLESRHVDLCPATSAALVTGELRPRSGVAPPGVATAAPQPAAWTSPRVRRTPAPAAIRPPANPAGSAT